jgi:hypothetical protein
VSPPLTSNDPTYVGLADLEAFPQLALTNASFSVEGADLANLPKCELMVASFPVMNYASLGGSTLSVAISHVVLMAAKKKVGWITTARVVAAVADLLLCGNLAKRKQPSYSMGFPHRFAYLDPKKAITEGIGGCLPWPAVQRAWRSIYLFPKALSQVLPRPSRCCGSGITMASPALPVGATPTSSYSSSYATIN